jgi:hypothetical protein
MQTKMNKAILRKILPKEADEQIALMQWMSTKFGYYEFYAPLSEQKAKVQYYVKLQKMGLKKGFFDLIIFRSTPFGGYKGLMIQLKRQLPVAAPVTQEQVDWANRIEESGFKAIVCYGCENAIIQITQIYCL